MINALPKWVWNRYALLWKEFEENPFTFEQAQKVLKYLDRNTISVMFNELKKSGWLKVKLNDQDSRMRIYTLLNPIAAIEGVTSDIKTN